MMNKHDLYHWSQPATYHVNYNKDHVVFLYILVVEIYNNTLPLVMTLAFYTFAMLCHSLSQKKFWKDPPTRARDMHKVYKLQIFTVLDSN